MSCLKRLVGGGCLAFTSGKDSCHSQRYFRLFSDRGSASGYPVVLVIKSFILEDWSSLWVFGYCSSVSVDHWPVVPMLPLIASWLVALVVWDPSSPFFGHSPVWEAWHSTVPVLRAWGMPWGWGQVVGWLELADELLLSFAL